MVEISRHRHCMSNKIRNRFLALVLLLAFIGLGMLFYVNWVVQKPFAIILFLTDNLNTPSLTAARIYKGGADHRLSLESLPQLGLITTQAADFAVSDTAAAVTAIATGQKVNNRSVGVDSSGKPLENLIDLARANGRLVGLVTDSAISDPTPAAFFAKSGDPLDASAIVAQLADAPVLDVILGGGEAEFLPEHKEGRRKDGRDLMLELRRKGYDIARNKSEMENTPVWRAPKLLGIFAPGPLAFGDEIKAAGSEPSLADMVKQAIQLLQFNRKGYLLIVDAGLVGKAAAHNEGERMLRQIVALDDAVAAALSYAGENSLIIVAGKQSVGGLTLNGYPFRNDKGIAVTGLNPQGVPSLTWATGPGSKPSAGQTPEDKPASPAEPSAFAAPAAVGVAEDGIVVSSGPGAEKLGGFKDNTDIFKTIVEGL
jgi:alkaline phosphatase